jgi:hypothetical protein
VPNVAVYSIKIVSGSKRLIVRLFYKIYGIEDKIGTVYVKTVVVYLPNNCLNVGKIKSFSETFGILMPQSIAKSGSFQIIPLSADLL